MLKEANSKTRRVIEVLFEFNQVSNGMKCKNLKKKKEPKYRKKTNNLSGKAILKTVTIKHPPFILY